MTLRLSFCSFFAAVVCCGSNLLVNPGFETGNFTGWTTGGSSTSFGVATNGTLIPGTDAPFTPAVVNVRSGDFAAYANVRCGTLVAGCTPRLIFTLSQTVAVVPDSVYSAGFYLSDDSQSGMGVSVGDSDTQIFVNGTGILPQSQVNISGDTTFKLFSGLFPTGGSSSVTVTFQINGSGTSRAGVSLDDFFVNTAVPEPATLELLAFGLALLTISLRIRRA